MFSEKFPLSISWYTTFAGNDYRETGKRAWSSYCELSYPFNVKDVNLSIEAGFTPWESFYSNKFNVVNVGLSATKELKITSNFSLPIFGKLIANPYEEQVYFCIRNYSLVLFIPLIQLEPNLTTVSGNMRSQS